MPINTKRGKAASPYSASERYRWMVRLDEQNGAEVLQRATRQGTKPGIWLREAAIERLERERAEDVAKGRR